MAAAEESDQQSLAALWTSARRGCLTPWSEAKVWALREAYLEHGPGKKHGLNERVAKKVRKVGGGHPTARAIGLFYAKVDDDLEWFPGKRCGSMGGRPKALTAAQRNAIARSAMALKARGQEPTAASVIAQCPLASLNAATHAPVDKRAVYDVMRSLCHDGDPAKPWVNGALFSKSALTAEDMLRRYHWAVHIANLRHRAQWYHDKVIFTDICNSILPTNEKKANEQALARKNKRAWRPPGSELKSRNLSGRKETIKQKGWGTRRLYWVPVLCRGKFHIEFIGENCKGDDPRAMGIFVQKLRAAVNARFPAQDKPRLVFTDKGRGFYAPSTSKVKQASSPNQSALNHGTSPVVVLAY